MVVSVWIIPARNLYRKLLLPLILKHSLEARSLNWAEAHQRATAKKPSERLPIFRWSAPPRRGFLNFLHRHKRQSPLSTLSPELGTAFERHPTARGRRAQNLSRN